MKKLCTLFAMICCAFLVLSLNSSQAPAGDGAGSCEGDVNADGQVNVLDLIQVLSNWGDCPAPCDADLNGDGVVNVQDLLVVIANFGPCDAPACASSSDCDDNDPCTIDICIQGTCHNLPIPDCK